MHAQSGRASLNFFSEDRAIKAGVWIETNATGINSISYEAISAALSGDFKGRCQAIAVSGDPESLCREIGARGVQELAFLKVPEPEKSPDRLAKALAWHIQSTGLSDFVAVGTGCGRDLISRVAAILEAPLLSDCVKLDLAAGVASKYIISGRLLASYQMPGPTNFYAIRPHSWKEGKPCADHHAKLTLIKPPSQPAAVRVVRREVVDESPDLFESRVIVGTGRAIGSAENMSFAQEVAQKLGGTIAASRSAVDAGYAPPSIQIGLTGSVVSPDLYIACGVSGSIHHMAGVKTARTIVAINKDRSAPIFKWSDYGLEGDLFEVLPLLSRFLGTGCLK